MKKFLVVTTLLAVLVLSSMPAAAVEKLYFADVGNDEIMRCNLDGSGLEALVTTGLSAVGRIAINRTGGKMYWTDWPSATAHIMRANLDGTGVETVLSGLQGPWGIALDVPNGKMYWTEFSIDKIRRANLDGSSIEDLVTTGLTHLAGIALDLGGGKMYWCDGATQYTAKIQRSNMDGSGVETLIEDPLIAPQDIALDLDAGKMYFTDIGLDSLYRANLDGSGMEAIVPSVYGTPPSLCLDLVNLKVYYSDYGGYDAEIKRCNLDGTSVEVILSTEVQACYGLTLGPAEAECSDADLDGVWLALIAGVEVYDYAVWMIFDGAGTIDDMGAFNVPATAGSYAVAPDCSLSGEIWTDGYTPFTGYIHSDTLAEVDLGFGPFNLLKVSDVGALEGCWTGHFLHDAPSGLVYYVTINIDANGNIMSSTGFPAPVYGKIFTEQGYLAGLFQEVGPSPGPEYMLLDAAAYGDTVLAGTFDKDCPASECFGGTFNLRRCDISGAGEVTPVPSYVWIRNYPNPFNPQTTIVYSLSEVGRARIRVYDAAGRFVKTLVNGVNTEGKHDCVWDGRDRNGEEVSSGVYFLRFETGGEVLTRKIVLIKSQHDRAANSVWNRPPVLLIGSGF